MENYGKGGVKLPTAASCMASILIGISSSAYSLLLLTE